MNNVRLRTLLDNATGCFCVLGVFVLRVCLGSWNTVSFGTRIYLSGAMFVCVLGLVLNHRIKKALPESA